MPQQVCALFGRFFIRVVLAGLWRGLFFGTWLSPPPTHNPPVYIHHTDWPRSLGVYVIQPPLIPPKGVGTGVDDTAPQEELIATAGGGSGMVPNYKADVCAFFRAQGLWQPFWWAN